MKKIILFSMLLIMSAASFSQETKPSPALTKQDYLLKSKHQKTAAWVLAGGGVGLYLIALVTTSADKVVNTVLAGDSDFGAGPVLLVLGGVAVLTSIPLFIASGKNKRRAMSVSFKNETAPQIQKRSFVYQTVPSLTLKIKL